MDQNISPLSAGALPLNLTKEDGYGYFPASPGLFLKDGQYQVLRMVGRGRSSSVYMAQDMFDVDDPEVEMLAIKILTAYATELNKTGRFNELQTLQAISEEMEASSSPPFLPELLDCFEITSLHGTHLCFVQHLCATDVDVYRRTSPTQALLLHDVKMVVSHCLYPLELMHKLGLIHTNIKATNILVEPGVEDPVPVIVDGEVELQGKKYPVMHPQPLPHTFEWDDRYMDTELKFFSLNGVGHAVSEMQERDYELSTSLELRAPEIILQSGYDHKIDIWAIGCMTFELLTGHPLFRLKEGEGWKTDGDHLRQMLELTGETFSQSMLARSKLRDHFFTEDGILKNPSIVRATTIENTLIACDTLAAEDVKPAAKFIAACLHLDPLERPSVIGLVHHPWLSTPDYRRPLVKPRPRPRL